MRTKPSPLYEFQSAPPAGARGDEVDLFAVEHFRLVSIRSPRRSEGRSEARCQSRFCSGCFNPLPPPERGEIPRIVKLSSAVRSFNPLPPPERGEIFHIPLPPSEI